MRIRSPFNGGLFIVECARFSFLTGVLAILRHNAGAAFPWQIYAVPNALFLLMALFLWLDASKYRVYAQLFIAGKVLSLFSVVISWFASRNMGAQNFYERGLANPSLVLAAVFIGDLLSLVFAVFVCIKIYKKPKPVLSESGPNNEAPALN